MIKELDSCLLRSCLNTQRHYLPAASAIALAENLFEADCLTTHFCDKKPLRNERQLESSINTEHEANAWFQKLFNVLVNLVPCRTVSEQSPLLHLSENRGVRLGAALCVLTKPMRTELGLRSSSVDEDGLPVFPILYASTSFIVQHGKAMCGSKNLQYIHIFV